MAADCKSAAPCGLRRFESSPVHHVGDWQSPIKKAAKRCTESGLPVGPTHAHVAQSVERVLGKDEVTSSILVVGSIFSFDLAGESPRLRDHPVDIRVQSIER